PLSRAHRHRSVRCHRLRKVLPAERARRRRDLPGRGTPPHHLAAGGRRAGRRRLRTAAGLARGHRAAPARWRRVSPRACRRHAARPPRLALLPPPAAASAPPAPRALAERLTAPADVIVWVTAPQKYADAVLHHDFVRPFAGHDAVTVMVLNQSDRLRPEERGA